MRFFSTYGPLKRRKETKRVRRETERKKKLNWNSHQACERESIKSGMKIVVMQAVGLPNKWRGGQKPRVLCADYNPFRSCGPMSIVPLRTSTCAATTFHSPLRLPQSAAEKSGKLSPRETKARPRAMAKFKVKQIQPKNDFCRREIIPQKQTVARPLSGKWDFVGCRLSQAPVENRTPIVMNYSCVTANNKKDEITARGTIECLCAPCLAMFDCFVPFFSHQFN